MRAKTSVSAVLVPLRLIPLSAVLAACSNTPSTPPSVALISPAVGTTLSGTVAVQVSAKDDDTITKVQVYARALGSKATGVALGSAA